MQTVDIFCRRYYIYYSKCRGCYGGGKSARSLNVVPYYLQMRSAFYFLRKFTMDKKTRFRYVLRKAYEYSVIAFAALLNAVSLHTFVNPNNLVPGGFSGLASIIYYLVKPLIENPTGGEMSLIYLLVNIPLLVFSLIFLRGDFTFKTIWATVVCSAFLAVLPENLIFADSKLICVIFGGVLIGAAMYVAAVYNGSNGGTEVIARLVAKYRPENDLSKVIFISNFIILIGGSVLVILQGEEIWIALYSFIYVLVGSSFMGMLTRGFDHPQKFMIVTSEYEAIAQEILSVFRRGLTCVEVFKADGSVSDKKMILVIVQYRQASILRNIIRRRDPSAFTFVKDVYDIFSRPSFNRSYKTK